MRLKPPARPEDITEALVSDLQAILGPDLLGVCLYGSAASGRYRQGASDINLLVLTADRPTHRASELIPFCAKWAPAKVATPLVVSPSYLAGSLDVFPIEFLTMAASHKVLFGPDPLAGLEFKDRHLRLQLEREFKAKLVALRTRLLASLGKPALLLELARQAQPAFTALFQAYLYLLDGRFPGEPDQIWRRLEERGLTVGAFRRLHEIRQGGGRPQGQELLGVLERAIDQLEEICRQVDALEAPGPGAD